MSRPDLAAPWPEPTVQVPQRIGGWRVVAAACLPANALHPYRYVVVVQASPISLGFVLYPEVTWVPRTGFVVTPGSAVSHIPLTEAVDRFRSILDTAYPRSTS